MDLVDYIIAWESGELSDWDTLQFFAKLIKSGECWTLQGCYGRQAQALIDAGYVSKEGEVLIDEYDLEC
jgi:hypothetical protein